MALICATGGIRRAWASRGGSASADLAAVLDPPWPGLGFYLGPAFLQTQPGESQSRKSLLLPVLAWGHLQELGLPSTIAVLSSLGAGQRKGLSGDQVTSAQVLPWYNLE